MNVFYHLELLVYGIFPGLIDFSCKDIIYMKFSFDGTCSQETVKKKKSLAANKHFIKV